MRSAGVGIAVIAAVSAVADVDGSQARRGHEGVPDGPYRTDEVALARVDDLAVVAR
jgi:hypothetical protein